MNPWENADELKHQQIEYRIHCAIVAQLPAAFPTALFWHTPNRPGNAADGFFKKKMGAKSGASDLGFSWNHRDKLECGWLELKAPGKNLESSQNKWLSAFSHIGWRTGMARTVATAFNILEDWGIPRKHYGVKEPDLRSDTEKKFDAFEFFKP